MTLGRWGEGEWGCLICHSRNPQIIPKIGKSRKGRIKRDEGKIEKEIAKEFGLIPPESWNYDRKG